MDLIIVCFYVDIELCENNNKAQPGIHNYMFNYLLALGDICQVPYAESVALDQPACRCNLM